MKKFSIIDRTPHRIEKILSELFPEKSRNFFSRACENGDVLINGRYSSRGTAVKWGDEIAVTAPFAALQPGRERWHDEIKPPWVVSDFAAFIVISKARGCHSVLLREDDELTVADQLASYFPATLHAGRDVRESGLVQRLDFFTSGLLLAATDAESWEEIHAAFIEKRIKKTYECLLPPNSCYVGQVLSSHLAVTGVVTTDCCSVVTFETDQGARHIVRKTCADHGFPLIGDVEFGSDISLLDLARSHARFSMDLLPEHPGGGRVAEESGFLLHAAILEGELPTRQGMKKMITLRDPVRLCLDEEHGQTHIFFKER